MPMPHRTFAQVAKRRLIGKEGRERIREVNALLAELPDYKNGPYADLRKWLTSEIEESRVRSNAVHRDLIAVRREGAAQICLVDRRMSASRRSSRRSPRSRSRLATTHSRRCGRSLRSLGSGACSSSSSRSRGSSRAPTTTGVGGGRCSASSAQPTRSSTAPGPTPIPKNSSRCSPRSHLPASTSRRVLELATRADEAGEGSIERIRAAFPDLDVVPVSVLDEASLEALRDAAWRLTGLIRVFLRTMGDTDPEPVALDPGATVETVADWVHHDLAATFTGARVWVPRLASMASAWARPRRARQATWWRLCGSRPDLSKVRGFPRFAPGGAGAMVVPCRTSSWSGDCSHGRGATRPRRKGDHDGYPCAPVSMATARCGRPPRERPRRLGPVGGAAGRRGSKRAAPWTRSLPPRSARRSRSSKRRPSTRRARSSRSSRSRSRRRASSSPGIPVSRSGARRSRTSTTAPPTGCSRPSSTSRPRS